MHVHLDGSIPLPAAAQLVAEADLISLAELKERCKVPTHCQDLNQYLATFELPPAYAVSTGHSGMVAKAFHEQLDAEGIPYAEPAAPGSLIAGGLSQQEVLEAALLVELTSMQSIHSQRLSSY